MSNTDGGLLTTGQVAERYGVTNSAVVKAVNSGRLRPARKLPGRTGAYLFRTTDVTRWADKRGAA